MDRARGKLTPAGRLLLVQRVTVLRWPLSQAAASMGVLRETAYEWLARWRRAGAAGLEDRSSRPHRSPRQVPAAVERRILMLRRRLKWGPHRLAPLVGHPRSTIYAVLARHGMTRLRDLDRSTGVPIRYVREHPGELLHLDMKPLARVPEGGGHRILGRVPGPHRRGAGYEVIHVAIDDASRLAFAQIRPDGRAPTVVQFLTDAVGFFAAHGIRIQRIMTDRGWSYNSRPASGPPPAGCASVTRSRVPIGRRPTAKRSALSKRCCASGRTLGCTARTRSAGSHFRNGCTTTIIIAPIRRWKGGCPRS